jgi:hypothetical protein
LVQGLTLNHTAFGFGVEPRTNEYKLFVYSQIPRRFGGEQREDKDRKFTIHLTKKEEIMNIPFYEAIYTKMNAVLESINDLSNEIVVWEERRPRFSCSGEEMWFQRFKGSFGRLEKEAEEANGAIRKAYKTREWKENQIKPEQTKTEEEKSS